MDLSIAIRTATVVNKRIIFSAGGGIVIDSDPDEEFDETLHKGRTLMEAFQGEGKESNSRSFAWINGTMKPMELVSVPVTDPGFQYGYGFFETIRVVKEEPKSLDEHIERFNYTWKQLFFHEPPDLSWNEIIAQVIRKNGLEKQIAAVKLIATKGDRNAPPYNHTLVVTARLYTHRLAGKEEPGLLIATYPEPRQTPLADHKTLNYLYYHLAGIWARDNGADEALIQNPDGTVSETNTGNILLIQDRTVTTPASPHVLPGTMEKSTLRLLSEWGYEIRKKSFYTKDLFEADQVFVTNALMGVVPVLSVDKRRISEPSDLWRNLNGILL